MPKSWSWNNSISILAWPGGGCFELEITDLRPGLAILQVSGNTTIFDNEAGGHRWQRVPPNEKRGRVHTSTITVALLRNPTPQEFSIGERDLDISICRGSGPGGQHRNKTSTAVQITHRPTKTRVRCEAGRSLQQNKETALRLLKAKLWAEIQQRHHSRQSALRRSQIGSGMRGDKRRTIRVQHGVVEDHVTGQSWRYRDYRSGNWDAIRGRLPTFE